MNGFDWMQPQGQAPAPATPLPTNNFSSVMQPQQPGEQEAIAQIQQPTSDPQVIEQRKQGWLEVLKQSLANPNITRALGMFGGAALQPRAPGQTTAGHLGQAMMLGRSAYDFGEQSEFDRRMAMSKEEREKAESEARIGQTTATTRSTNLDADLKSQTMGDAVAKIKLEKEKAEQDIAKAKDEATKRAIELAYTKRVDDIRKGIPDATIRGSLESELQKAGVEIKLRNAQAAQAGATAGYYAGRTKDLDAERKLLQNLPEEEQRQFVTKTGKYAAGLGSAQAQMASYYQANWKKANPKIMGETDQSYEQRAAKATDTYLTTAKEKPDSEEFLRWAGIFGKGNATEDYADFLKWKGKTPSGSTPGGAATGKAFIRDKDGKIVPGQ